MPTAEARIQTDRPERYLVQLCQHASAMGGAGHGARMHGEGHRTPEDVEVHAEWSDTRGDLSFAPWGTCAVTVEGTSLSLRIEAVDGEALRRIQDIVSRDLDRFGRRDGLVVQWQDR